MKITDIVKITNGKTNIDYINKEIKEIKIDSREINTDDVFICINSGINYIEDAISAGALAIITDKFIENNKILIIYVSNIVHALKYLSEYLLKTFKGKIIAITGSNGKTTTKELISHILSSKYKVLKNMGSENNFIGVPKTILKLNNSYDYIVLELGMNHVGEIEYLSKLIKPDIGVITNIGTAHIGYLGSKENIFKAKSELLLGNKNMKLYINGNDEYLKRLNGIFVYENDYNNIFESYHCSIDYAIATHVCEDLGISLSDILKILNDFKLPKSRMKEIKVENKLIIDDSYNASYESFNEGLKTINKLAGRKIIIFGDMLELGEYSNRIHEDLMARINEYPNLILYTIGPITRELREHNNFNTLEELKECFKSFKFLDNDIIYLKGSNKMKLYSLVPYFEEILK